MIGCSDTNNIKKSLKEFISLIIIILQGKFTLVNKKEIWYSIQMLPSA